MRCQLKECLCLRTRLWFMSSKGNRAGKRPWDPRCCVSSRSMEKGEPSSLRPTFQTSSTGWTPRRDPNPSLWLHFDRQGDRGKTIVELHGWIRMTAATLCCGTWLGPELYKLALRYRCWRMDGRYRVVESKINMSTRSARLRATVVERGCK